MQVFSNYVPERNYLSELHNIVAILLFKYMVHVMLFPTIKCFLSIIIIIIIIIFHSTCYQRLRQITPGHIAF